MLAQNTWNADLQRWLSDYDWKALNPQFVASVLLLGAGLALGFLGQAIARAIIRRHVEVWVERSTTQLDNVLYERKVFSRLARLMPGVTLFLIAPIALPEQPTAVDYLQRLALSYIVVVVALSVRSLLQAIEEYYRLVSNAGVPIKSYTQMAMLLIAVFSGVLVIAVVLNKSPLYLLSGLGAMTAIVLLVFKDALLGMVASIQLAANDMVRIGDWIEVPKYGADGEVLDITLTTVKVKNWDKTLSMLPTYALVSDAFRNWRGMKDAGGRRIKRSVPIDMNTIRHCTPEMIERYRAIALLTKYLDRKCAEIDAFNQEHGVEAGSSVNGRHLTNIGVFRAYVEAYLRAQSQISGDFTFLVRQLDPSSSGLPIEIYVFSATTEWAAYEGIQADLFDHLLAILPQFGLRVLQAPGGADVRSIAEAMSARTSAQ